MHICDAPRPLGDRNGTELLIMSIVGGPDQRRRIEMELNLRALLAEGPRRSHAVTARPRLRLVGGSRAA